MMAHGPMDRPRGNTLWRSVKAVLWSFLGIRQNRASHEDMSSLNPVHIIVVALVALGLFVGALVALVHWVVG
ncbi:DUF2970 domain-containing protein [Ramlibacter sp.]|uniref:DUF2970 domain-containing protein n=1 Tax=Ramlibacter sp. TaxID=1917967 RepID=UPI002CE72213|nr:DUF2970 domain-containing protein [Ramlibacter sp.]HWI81450.1 DUF2970 domain-containing protein [Ramlibacter sp.]